VRPSLRHEPESVLTQSTANDLDAVYSKIGKRIVPFTILLFLMAWLDRYNLGFAKLQMVKDLGFSESVYGFGAGIASKQPSRKRTMKNEAAVFTNIVATLVRPQRIVIRAKACASRKADWRSNRADGPPWPPTMTKKAQLRPSSASPQQTNAV